MTKEDVLQAAINEGNEYEFISWDGLTVKSGVMLFNFSDFYVFYFSLFIILTD